MCTVNIQVDDETMQRIRPELKNRKDIGAWLQHRVDLMIEEMAAEDTETMDIEEAREMTLKAVREEYARP